jgi:heme exporter protein D
MLEIDATAVPEPNAIILLTGVSLCSLFLLKYETVKSRRRQLAEYGEQRLPAEK